MTSGLIGYAVSAAIIGALYGGLHTYKILNEQYAHMHAVKTAALVTSGALLGATINPIALPFYPFLCTMNNMYGCPLSSFHNYLE